jgi:L-asparaginase II
MRVRIDVTVRRGEIGESRHRMQAVARDAAGATLAATPDADGVTTFRSAAKPFQLLPLVERGHAERWGLSDEELAVMSASHTGSAYHVALVRGILSRLELTDRDLACGYHDPIDPDSLTRLTAHPESRSPVYNNCSGKHAGMLCLAVSEGWPVAGYERADHPLQRLMLETVSECCGLPPERVAVAVDGCSVSVFGVPLTAMAGAYAKLSAATPAGDGRSRSLDRIRRAMQAHPRAVGGNGRFSTALMQASGGRLVAKGGAEGLQCVGLPDRGLGLALKCEDGQARAVPCATLALLEHLGWLDRAAAEALREWRRPVVHNHAGTVVGRLEPAVHALSPTDS